MFLVTDPIWHITEGNMHLGRTCWRTMEDSQNWNTMAGRSGQYNFQGYATSEDRVLTSYVCSPV